MKNRTPHLLISVVAMVLLFGCSALEKNLSKFGASSSVENNTVQSSLPALRIKVAPDLGYIGSVRTGSEKTDSYALTSRDDQGSFRTVSYLFGQIGPDKRLVRGVIVRLLAVAGSPNQAAQERYLQDISPSGTIDSGKMKIFDEEYKYTLFLENDIFTQAEKTLLAGKVSPTCSLVRQIEKKAGFGNKSLALISYFEDLNPCPGDVKNLTGKEQFISDFTDRSYSAIRFLEPEKTFDATSRYTDPGQSDSSTGKGSEAVRPDMSGSVERRLQTLKDLYDKNLISKEDYEKKKAEILGEL